MLAATGDTLFLTAHTAYEEEMDVTRRTVPGSPIEMPGTISSRVPNTFGHRRALNSSGVLRPASGRAVVEVEFPSEGAVLRGLLFVPEEHTARVPAVVMAHGTSATVRMVADKYAERLSESGFAVLLYDHRNLGRSGGEPRQEINPWIQCRGYRDAISYVSTLDIVDPDRIALWGDSFSGGEVIVVGAMDVRVKAIVAQCPTCGAAPPTQELSDANFEVIRSTLLTGDVAGSPETSIGPMPVVSADQLGSPSLLKPIQAFRWFIDYGGRPGTYWVNNVTRVVPNTPVPYSPVLCAPYVQAPILIMAAPDDEMEMASYAVARFAYDAMPYPKEWYDIRGGHFGLLYYPGEVFDEAIQVQIDFLQRCL
jgi:dienelactone hydrolase